MIIRPAQVSDAHAIADIYAHYVRETVITFACTEPTPESYAVEIREGKYPFLVAEEAGQAQGFAYAGEFRTKEAFRWDVELTLYLRPGMERQGTGTRLMKALLALLRRQGFLTAYSCVTLPNPGSLALQKHLGFETLGIFPKTGYKHGRWLDVIWLQLSLGSYEAAPADPIPFSALSSEEVLTIIHP